MQLFKRLTVPVKPLLRCASSQGPAVAATVADTAPPGAAEIAGTNGSADTKTAANNGTNDTTTPTGNTTAPTGTTGTNSAASNTAVRRVDREFAVRDDYHVYVDNGVPLDFTGVKVGGVDP